LCLFYNDFFLLRRLLFTLILVCLRHVPTIQIQLFICLSVMMIAYLGWVKPFIEKNQNRLYIADEMILLGLTSLMLYHDAVGLTPEVYTDEEVLA